MIILGFLFVFFMAVGLRNELKKAGVPFGKFVFGLIAIFIVLVGLLP